MVLTDRFAQVWKDFLIHIRKNVSDSSFQLWFSDAVPITIMQGNLFLLLDEDFKRVVFEQRYAEEVKRFFTAAYESEVCLCLLSSIEAKAMPLFSEQEAAFREEAKQIYLFVTQATLNEVATPNPLATAEPTPSPVLTEQPLPSPGRFVIDDTAESDHTPSLATDSGGRLLDFDHFIVGSSNKFAHAACLAVAKEPAKYYNPLFIHGPSGLGKTHLLNAIINYLRLNRPELKIRYVKGDEFTNQMIESISFNRTEQFRESYRKVDVLFIDDIQFIAGKESTQEEFFHTFNALHEDEKQIILTSDRPPRDIPHLEERLRSRFEWGLIADIQPPDLELRVAILKNKSKIHDLEIPNEVLTFIAENLVNNVRQLEGAIKKIAAQSKLMGLPVTMDLAFRCISDMIVGSEPVAMTADKVIAKVARKYEVSIEDIKGQKRTKQIATARHVAVYLIRELTNMSLPQMGKYFGRDHATILSSYNKIQEEIKKDALFDLEIKELLNELQGK